MKKITLFIILSLTQLPAIAQETNAGRNILKVNLFSLPMRCVSLQYERGITDNIAVGLGLRLQPKGTLPLKGVILDQLDPLAKTARDFVNQSRVSNWAITPEARYYFGKKPLNGFYVGIWGRYGQYGIQWAYPFADDSNKVRNLDFSGKMKVLSLGLQLGTQFSIGKNVKIDWWIAGPHLANVNTTLQARGDLTDLDQYERARLKILLEGFSINDNHMTTDINDNGVTAKFNINTVGLRTGLCVGFAF